MRLRTSCGSFSLTPSVPTALVPTAAVPYSALQVARRAEILSPLGALYYNTGRHEEALRVYREAAALEPSQREPRLALVSWGAVGGTWVWRRAALRGAREALGTWESFE